MVLEVECYAGYRADERPLRFSRREVPDGRSSEVKQVLDQWYGPSYRCFRVLADDNNVYVLRHDSEKDIWTLDSFEHGSS